MSREVFFITLTTMSGAPIHRFVQDMRGVEKSESDGQVCTEITYTNGETETVKENVDEILARGMSYGVFRPLK